MNNPNAADNLKPFKKGDPRINRKGRPKNFDALRKLAQEIGHEIDLDKDGEVVTKVEKILRSWASGRVPMLQKEYVAIGWGKVPDNVEVGGQVKIKVVYDEPTNNNPSASET